MGNVTVSTKNTQVYYPTDWLIEGGPPFESTEAIPNDDAAYAYEDIEPLQVIYNKTTEYFGITHNHYIVMESKDPRDVAQYVLDYVEGFKQWVEDQK